MWLQLLFVLLAIIVGARVGGIGLGVFGGLGLAVLTFVFGLEPTTPPIDVMLMIVAVIAAAGCMQAAGGLDLMCRRIGFDGEMGRENLASPSSAHHAVESAGDLPLYLLCRNGACGLFRTSGYCRSGS